jgi:hypothetical protein
MDWNVMDDANASDGNPESDVSTDPSKLEEIYGNGGMDWIYGGTGNDMI